MKVDKDMWELNVLGTVSLTRNVLPHMMKRRQGHVAVISSTVGLVGQQCLINQVFLTYYMCIEIDSVYARMKP